MNDDKLTKLLEEVEHAKKVCGEKSTYLASCYYDLGVYYVNHGEKMKAMEAFGDCLYIRKNIFSEDSIYVREIYYGLEQCTFM